MLLAAGATVRRRQRSRHHAAASGQPPTAMPRSSRCCWTAARGRTTAAPSGVTPLMEAARSGSVEAVRLLLAHGADVNARERARRPDRADVGGRAAAPGHRRAAARARRRRSRAHRHAPADGDARPRSASRREDVDAGRAHAGAGRQHGADVRGADRAAPSPRGCCWPPAPTRTTSPPMASRRW